MNHPRPESQAASSGGTSSKRTYLGVIAVVAVVVVALFLITHGGIPS